MATYVVYGDPVPLARHRHMGRRTWDSQKQLKVAWGLEVLNQHNRLYAGEKYTGPVHIDVIFFMGMPQKISKKVREEKLGAYHYYAPDIDNLIKLCLDAATGILFDNDCVVASITSKKVYAEVPRTEFTIISLK